MKFSDKEIKFLRLGLNPSAQGNEVDTSAQMLFRSLRERGVSAELIVSGGNGNSDSDSDTDLNQKLRKLEELNFMLNIEVGAMRRETKRLKEALAKASAEYANGYSAGRLDGERAVRSERAESAPKHDHDSGRSRKTYDARSSFSRAFHATEEQNDQKRRWEQMAADYDGESEDFQMEFGKYRGHKLSDVSLNYLEWTVGPKGLIDMPNTRDIIEDYLEKVRRDRR